MSVEAFILVKTVPGTTPSVVYQLAASDDHVSYNIKGMEQVYRASGDYDIIALVSSEDTQGVLSIADQIGNIAVSSQPAVSETNVLFCVPKRMGDP